MAASFFGSDGAAIGRVLCAFRDPAQSPSSGEVKSGAIFTYAMVPHRDGMLSETIFGRRGDLAERWGHVRLASPCLHPALAPLIAKRLQTSVESVLAVARAEAWWDSGHFYGAPGYQPSLAPGSPFWEWEPAATEDLEPALRELTRVNTALRRLGALPEWAKEQFGTEVGWFDEALAGCGSTALARALPEVAEMLIDVVPIPPLALRPFIERPGGLEHVGETNLALARLVFLNEQLSRMKELEASALELRGAERLLQLAFEEVVHRLSPSLPAWLSPEVLDHLPELGDQPRPVESCESEIESDPDEAQLSIALAGDMALITGQGRTLPFGIADASIGESIPTHRLVLLQVDSDASHAVFFDPLYQSLHVLDLARRRWCDERPEFLRFLLKSGAEGETQMVEVASRRATRRSPYPDWAISACGRFYMECVEGPRTAHLDDGWVVRSLDGEPIFEPALDAGELPLSWIFEDGELRVFEDESEADECRWSAESRAGAFVLAESGDFLSLIHGVLARGRTFIAGFGFSVKAAAFDSTGRRLLCASREKLTLFDVRGELPKIIDQWNLPAFGRSA